MPEVYDVELDRVRPVTQADVDVWQAIEQAYNALRQHIDTSHAALVQRVRRIRSRAGVPDDPA